MPQVEYDDSATEIDGPHVAQKKWLDSIETIPFDPSMRVSEASMILSEGTPPRAVAPVRVPEATPRPRRQARPATHRPPPQRPPVRHPLDNVVTKLTRIDVAGGHVSFSPDPDLALPLPSIPTPLPAPSPLPMHAPYGAPALPPHAPTAMALPLPTQLPTQVAQSLPALVQRRDDGVTPYPVPPWAGAQPQRGYPLPQNHLDIYSDNEDRYGDTPRVAALPPSMPVSLRPPISRYLLPMIGGTALVVFVAGYFLVRGDSQKRPAAPVAAAAVMPVQPSAPIVTEIPVEKQLPDPSWKQREAQPTIVAKVEPVVAPVEEVAQPADEIEMAPMVAKPTVAKKSSSSSSSARRAKRAQVAVIELPAAKPAKIAKAAPIAKPAKKSDKAIAKSAKADRDPILEEIEKPTKSAQAKTTGPGKLRVTSSVPTLIYVDGRSTNLMTPKTLNLSAGTHKITLLELKSRKAKTADIDVASGSMSQLDKKF